MCLNPILLPNGNEVACHKCWQCIRRKIDDWTGRCVAEGLYAYGCHSVTLTYGRDLRYDAIDHVKAALLTYSDVQRFLRRFRDEGYPVRYFVVGEYGSKKGRAHWHCLLFWVNRIPRRELGRNIECPMWEHGHTFWREGTPESLSYVTKYIVKEVIEDERQYHQAMSKYPPLGDLFFRALAQEHIDQRIAPQDLFYSFPAVRDAIGRKKKFMIQGKTRENYLRYFTEGWWQRYGEHPPTSELLEEYDDDMSARGSPSEARAILADEKAKAPGYRDVVKKSHFTGTVSKPHGDDLRRWMIPQRVKYDEKLNVYKYTFEGDQAPWYWAKDAAGVYGWRVRIGESFVSASSRYHDLKS